MPTTAAANLLHYFSPMRLLGPLSEKELRVASRQRKYYLLRFAYVCLLALVTVQLWFVTTYTGGGTSAVVRVSRLSEAGQRVIVAVVWSQFVMAQILAAVLLSEAISSEIRQRTLEGLLVTPLGALHIVLGKLLSRLLQILLLLAISLPVLAVVRVLGGVPWDYVVSGLCITLSAAVFAGALSLFYSTTQRHGFQAVLVVGVWYLVVWGILPWLVMSLTRVGYIPYATAAFVLSLADPVLALLGRTQVLLRGPRGATTSAPLLLHGLTIFAAAAFLLALSVRRVRRIAVVDKGGSLQEAEAGHGGMLAWLTRQVQAAEPVRRVKGAPIVWKELCIPLFRARRQLLFHILLWVAVAGFVFVLLAYFGPRVYGSFFIPILILHWLFMIRLGVAAAGAVTREKEARTWAVLLATPLAEEEIVRGKAFAAFRRNLPLLVPLSALYVLAAVLGPTYTFNRLSFLVSIGVGLAASVVFLLGVGVYLSTRLKTTAGAVASTLGVYFAPKLFCCGIPGPLFVLTPGSAHTPFAAVFAVALVLPALVYVAAGLLCLRAATRRVRRNIF
jgi:ABC-type transport system involved in multi-copper enzyme maturation permease subunit